MAAMPLFAQGATSFANPAFQAQWQSVESTIPNFWGPLATARDGQIEPYVEGSVNGQAGSRLVQYFDKARMELTNPATGNVSNGLLTVELKSGQLQLGDNSFQGLQPAQIGIAGDPGSPGPTYATLGILQERDAQSNGSVALTYSASSNTFTMGAPSTDANAAFATYLSDPNGRFGQNVPRAFADFLQRIPGGYLSSMGYPISPAFQATVTVGGQQNVPVIIQAFQRKVLTFTPSNPAAFQVEFGNIGQHYYQWRTAQGNLPTATGSATSTLTMTTTPTSGPTQTPVVVTATTVPTQTAVVVTATPIPTAIAPTVMPTAIPPMATPAGPTPIPQPATKMPGATVVPSPTP